MTRKEEIYNAARKSDAPFYFQEGANWADEHPNWISLKDMKPPLMERVFLYAEGWHEPSIGKLMIVGGKEVYLDEDFSKVIADEITLWMSFPKAPKKGGTQ
jgi:hypothetical protein